MRRVSIDVSLEIDASTTHAWDLLVDTDRWPEWGPSIIAVRSSSRRIGYDVSGEVRTAFGGWLPFRVDDYVEGCRWSWRVAGVRATGHRVERLGARRCRIVFEVPVLAAPYALMCHIALRRLRSLLESTSDGPRGRQRREG